MEAADVFARRKVCDAERQPDCASVLEAWNQLVGHIPPHPYGHWTESPEGWKKGAQNLYRRLLEEHSFSQGLRLLPVEPSSSSLYHFTTIDSIARLVRQGLVQQRLDNPDGILLFSAGRDLAEIYQELQDLSQGDWLQLGSFLSGAFHDERKATWWTCERIEISDIYRSWLEMGLYPQPVFPILLRLDYTGWRETEDRASGSMLSRSPSEGFRRQSNAYLPLATDAYAYPVFDAQTLDAHHGLTIDLSHFPQKLVPGKPEYVLHEVPIDRIWMQIAQKPLDENSFMSADRSDIHYLRASFWTALWEYLS